MNTELLRKFISFCFFVASLFGTSAYAEAITLVDTFCLETIAASAQGKDLLDQQNWEAFSARLQSRNPTWKDDEAFIREKKPELTLCRSLFQHSFEKAEFILGGRDLTLAALERLSQVKKRVTLSEGVSVVQGVVAESEIGEYVVIDDQVDLAATNEQALKERVEEYNQLWNDFVDALQQQFVAAHNVSVF